MAMSAYIEPTERPLMSCCKNSVIAAAVCDRRQKQFSDSHRPTPQNNSRIYGFFIDKLAALDSDDDGGLLCIAIFVERGFAGHAIEVFERRQRVADFCAVGG